MPLFRKEDPLPDMSRSDRDQTAVESGNKFSVADWEQMTEGWQPLYKVLAEAAREQHFIRRRQMAEELKSKAREGEIDEEFAGLVADIYSLRDDALQRLNTALENNERAGKLAEPPKRGGLLSRFRK